MKNKLEVFLGGSVSGWDWRSVLIPKLRCDYFNPVTDDRTEEDIAQEIIKKNSCDIILFTITNSIDIIYDIADVVDYAHKKPGRVIFCDLFIADTSDSSSIMISKSLGHAEKLLKELSVCVVNDLNMVAGLCNDIVRMRNSL